MIPWRALATDFDGTFAREGVVELATYAALGRLKEAGLLAIMVTGRELRDFPTLQVDLSQFDLIVAENGAVIYDPQTAVKTQLAPAPVEDLVTALRARGVDPLSVGETIIATTDPHANDVLECIKELGLELTITFNKGWVMVLPSTVNKASGLTAALERLQLAATEVVGVGDAENDHAFLAHCGYGVAVANALPSLKEKAHFVTTAEAGAGVVELIEKILTGDLEPAILPPPAV